MIAKTDLITNEDIIKYYHDPTITGADAAAALGISERTLIRLAQRRGLPTRGELGIYRRGAKRAKWDCKRCRHLAWCRANPYAYQLPCEDDGTPYRPAR